MKIWERRESVYLSTLKKKIKKEKLKVHKNIMKKIQHERDKRENKEE